MTTLIVGASGATGRLLAKELLERGEQVRIIVRSAERLPDVLRNQMNLSITEASISHMSHAEISQHVNGCDAIASCLGHNLTFRGLFAPPYRLVTDAVRKLSNAAAAENPVKPVKFVLMNTTGNRNRDLDEPISPLQSRIIGILRALLPPHADNEAAADYLRTQFGQNNKAIEWAAVRPDGLTDEPQLTKFDIHPSPIRSAIFDAGVTSRINVAGFMSDLITEENIWAEWKGFMPMIYNADR